MTKNDKKLIKFLNNPTSLKFKQIEKILIKTNHTKIETKSSHIKYKHPDIKNDIIIPLHNNDCKPFYKKQIAKRINNLINHNEANKALHHAQQ